MKRSFPAVLLLLAVTACAAQPAAPTRDAGIRTIGIVSSIGDTVAYQRVGAVPSHSETTAGDTSSWQLDDYVADVIKTKLAVRYTIAPVAVDHAALRRPRKEDDPLATESGPTVTERLQSALKPGTAPVDAYLVVSIATAKDFIGGTNHNLTGLAIYRRAGSGLQIYAVCDLALIDAHSFQTIDSASLRLERDRMFGGTVSTVERAYTRLDRSLEHQTRWDQFTASQQLLIDDAFKDLLRNSLDYTLRDMKLAP
jgi:hypothetical protein